ncbi:Basic-leucine zipper domain [Phaffia rhodozyma]|uniref:Basic-leucine zipper domain n=1 Tax=Phaffia rhodozyma TaxID=264483 RepID=A0A0F7SFP6_PHARH|nr:Basic-leucine zipper domain [Phaffia rhodozyma]
MLNSGSAPSPNQPPQIPQAILQQLLQEPSILSLLSRLEQQQPNTSGSPSGSLSHNSFPSNSSFTAVPGIPTPLSNGFTPEPVTTRSGRPSRPPQPSLQLSHNLSHADDQLAALHQAWAGLDTSFLDGIAGSLNISNSLPSSGPISAHLPTDPFTSSASLLEPSPSASNVTGTVTASSTNLDLGWWWPFQDEENEDEDPSYDPSMAYPNLTPPTFNLITPGPSTTNSLAEESSQPAASTSGSMERLLNNASKTSSKRKGKGKAILEEALEASITNTSVNIDTTKFNTTESAPANLFFNNDDVAAGSSIQDEEDDDEGEPGRLPTPGGRLLRKRKVKERSPPPPSKKVKLTAEESAARRKARNKELASNSRKRQRDYVVGLEARIIELEAEVKKYKLVFQQAARSIKPGPGKNIYDVVSGGIKNPHPFANLPSIPASVPYKASPLKKNSSKKKHTEGEEEEQELPAEVAWPEDEEEDDEWQSQGEDKEVRIHHDSDERQGEGHDDNHLEDIEGRPAKVLETSIGPSEEGVKQTRAEEVRGNEEEEEDEDDDEDDEDSDSEDSALEDEDDEDLYQPIIDVPIPIELAPPPPTTQTETALGGSDGPMDAPGSIPAGEKVGNQEIMDLLKKLLAKMGGA